MCENTMVFFYSWHMREKWGINSNNKGIFIVLYRLQNVSIYISHGSAMGTLWWKYHYFIVYDVAVLYSYIGKIPFIWSMFAMSNNLKNVLFQENTDSC